MATVAIEAYRDTLVLHFGSDQRRINAYTLASTLAGIADAAKAANAVVNPGYEIEIVVEALEGGSFRATIRAVYSAARNLFSADSARNIVLGIVATIIYEHTLGGRDQVIVNVTSNEVVVVHGDDRIIVPRSTYESAKQLEADQQVRAGLGRALSAVREDPAITSFGLGPQPKEPPPLQIPRERFVPLPAEFEADTSPTRVREEITVVQILRAILEKSQRRWQFVWSGQRISAPVLDDSFFEDFFAHRITIAPGDALRVRLRIKQRRLPGVDIYVNDAYEIAEVLDHIPRRSDPSLGLK